MEAELGVEAYERLFEKTPRKKVIVTYSGRFRDYGANITSTTVEIRFRLSKEFLETDESVRIGVMQYLLCKLYNSKKRTLEMDLYDSFLKKVGEWSSAGTEDIEDAELQKSFSRVNENYFDGYLIPPRIQWGNASKSRLGYYSFSNDTITLSTVLRKAGDVLDYVMYHELLHKKHKYEMKGNRAHSHTPAFRRDEKRFRMRDGTDPEKALHAYLRTFARARKKSKGFVEKLLDYF